MAKKKECILCGHDKANELEPCDDSYYMCSEGNGCHINPDERKDNQ